MRSIRIVMVLALIYSNSLFAAGPSGEAAPNNGKNGDNGYYVITRKAGQDDSIARLPIKADELVQDAILQIPGTWHVSDAGTFQACDKNIWLARQDPHNVGHVRKLPVSLGSIETHCLVLPGDRIIIEDPSLLRQLFERCTAPCKRLAGILGFGENTVHGSSRAGGRGMGL
jgi:hypothetical protein